MLLYSAVTSFIFFFSSTSNSRGIRNQKRALHIRFYSERCNRKKIAKKNCKCDEALVAKCEKCRSGKFKLTSGIRWGTFLA